MEGKEDSNNSRPIEGKNITNEEEQKIEENDKLNFWMVK